MKKEWTIEDINEWVRCRDDIVYFSEKYVDINDILLGLVKVEAFDWQKNVLSELKENSVIVSAARQSRKTMTAVLVMLHKIVFEEYKVCAIVSPKAEMSRDILNRIKLAYDNLPEIFQHDRVIWNKGTIQLENGCKIIAVGSNTNNIRGMGISFLYIDEAAWLINLEEFMKAIYPAISVSLNSKILICSTPKPGSYFNEMCKNPVSKFKHINISWDRIPQRDEKWKSEMMKIMNETDFANDYLAEVL
jgi:hypothetical protein